MKVIFLAFANSAASPLEFLTEEDKGLNEILTERYELGDYIVHKESFATPADINKYLDRYKDDLAIFHFSGHAGKDNLLVGDQLMYATGIAAQLQYSAAAGVLKLVVLNGCSTKGQVKTLINKGIPAVVSTSAPVNDQSAKEFSLRFWQKLVREQNTIEEAFLDALGPAQAVTSQDIQQAGTRHLVTDDDDLVSEENAPLWRLDGINNAALQTYPVPYKTTGAQQVYRPNEKLLEILYSSYLEAKNPDIMDLDAREMRGDTVPDSTKQIAIVNSIPFPIGIHLQKLICPISESDEKGYDEPGLRRLEQIAQLFQITTEFLCIIMIAQLWETSIRYTDDFSLDDALKARLREYLQLNEKSREIYEYIPLIQSIRIYLEKTRTTNTELRNFIDQEILKDLILFDQDFEVACEYLSNIRKRVIGGKISEEKAAEICMGAEDALCVFVKPLGFIHRYHLTSVQNIDIMKLRHITRNKTEYKHRIIRCMQAIGKDEWNYYYMETFLDNWGVILLKCDVSRMKGKNYKVKVIDYLNLSPFVIDRNSFIDRADLAYIMFFKGEDDHTISFKRVKNPLSLRDAITVNKQEDDKDKFDAIRLQYKAFKEFIA